MEEKYLINYATQERVLVKSVEREKKELENIKEELEFYKSLFNSHTNSVIFNLYIKKKNGKNVWVDPVIDTREYLETLDRDKDIEEWLEPVKPSR